MPFLDLGIAQESHAARDPADVGALLPGYGGFRLLTNAILTSSPAQAGPLLVVLAWPSGAAVAARLLFRHTMRTADRGSTVRHNLAG